jgi:hypothetical protein
MMSEDINKALEAVGIEPIPFMELDEEMKDGLAQVFANKGFRKYMEFAYGNQLKAAVLKTENDKDMFFYKGRLLMLRELLVQGKKAFEMNLKKDAANKIRKES